MFFFFFFGSPIIPWETYLSDLFASILPHLSTIWDTRVNLIKQKSPFDLHWISADITEISFVIFLSYVQSFKRKFTQMKILLWKFNTLWTHSTVTMEFSSISQTVIFEHEHWPLRLRIVMGITYPLTESGSQVYVDLTLLQSSPFRSNSKPRFSSLAHAV